MKKYTEAEFKKAAKVLASRGASKGGKTRWAGKTAEQKKSHMSMMGKLSWKNRGA